MRCLPRHPLLLAGLTGLALMLAGPASDIAAAASARTAGRVDVAVDPAGSSARRPVPADFLGLSFEVKNMRELASLASDPVLVQLLRNLAPGIVRFGGVTADTQVAWSPGGPPPPWATTALGDEELRGAAELVRRAGWRALLALNLGHYNPQAAAEEAADAEQAFGPSLAAIELGNEPTGFTGYRIPLRTTPYTFGAYRAEVDGYRQQIEASVPGLPLAGPDSGTGDGLLPWLRDEAAAEHPALLTVHYYAQWCGNAPTSEGLLSREMRDREAQTLRRLARIQTEAAIPLRIGETNQSSCGGEEGLSNTFATALWATDFIARAMSAGLAGVNLHDVPYNPTGYSSIVADSYPDLLAGDLHAAPEYYALLLGRELEGLAPLRTSARGLPAGVSLFAFRGPPAPGGPGEVLRVLVVDERPHGRPALTFSLAAPAGYRGSDILRMQAPARATTSGVALGGQPVAADGSWRPSHRRHGARLVGGRLEFRTGAASADLVTVRVGGRP